MLDIICPYWEKMDYWGGIKFTLANSSKKLKNAMRRGGGGGGGSWVFVITFGMKSQLIIGLEKKLTFGRWGGLLSISRGRGLLRIMRHLLGSKFRMIIGQKTRKNAWYYRRVLKKKNQLSWAAAIFWALNHTLDHRENKSKNWLILRARLKKKMNFGVIPCLSC